MLKDIIKNYERQPTTKRMERDFTNHTYDEGFVSRICKELLTTQW